MKNANSGSNIHTEFIKWRIKGSLKSMNNYHYKMDTVPNIWTTHETIAKTDFWDIIKDKTDFMTKLK